MKVLQINSVYNTGSTGKIVRDLHSILKERNIDSLVIYGRGKDVWKEADDPAVIRLCPELYAKANTVRSMFTGIPYGGCELSTYRLIRLIERWKPDVVHLQCINEHFLNIYTLLQWLGKNRVPTVITLHAEFLYTANCGHANDCTGWMKGCGRCPRRRDATRSLWLDRTADSYRKMDKAFRTFGDRLRIISVSPWLKGRAAASPILKDKRHGVILNGLDTNVFYPRTSMPQAAGPEDSSESGIVFHATAMFRDAPEDPKGGWYIVRLAERLRKDGIRFIVAGKHEINGRLPDNVSLLGPVRDQNRMAEYYSGADVTVISSRRETFSMVCAESLCCGTPVAGFRAGGPETIALPEYSRFCKYGDLDALEKCVRELLKDGNNADRAAKIAERAAIIYDRERMADRYIEIYRQLMGEK